MKTCFITGAGRGIGAALATKLAGREFKVGINYRSSQASAQALAAGIRTNGFLSELFPGDLTSDEGVAGLALQVKSLFGKLDLFIHNAALPLDLKPLSQLDWVGDVIPQLDVAARGFLNCMQHLTPLMHRDSQVIVILSEALFEGSPSRMGSYLAAKGALLGLARAAKSELQSKGIRVDWASPTLTQTELLHNYDDRTLEILGSQLPQGRLKTPEETAEDILKIVTCSAD